MKKIYHRFFNISECEKISDKVFKTRIIFSTFVMLICCMAFCSATFAWFTSTKKVDISPIKAANYWVTTVNESRSVERCDYEQTVSYTCPLATEDKHTFTLRAGGSSKKGYCVITINGQIYGIVPTNGDASYTITIQAAEGTEITFSANWGEYNGEGKLYGNDSCIEVSRTQYVTYIVEDGATLEMLASYYHVSVEDIKLYNGITELIAGKEIKIPNTSVTTSLVIKQESVTEGNEGSTTQPSEGNGSPTTEGDTPPVNTEAQAPTTGTGEAANPETPATPSESESSVDNTTPSTETTDQELEGDAETQTQQNSETESIAVTE